jgi:small-conductance mechanosensitive channel
VLTLGSLAAATILGLSLVLDVSGQTAAAGLAGNLGVLVLLFTPVAGLLATWSELRIARPAHGWMAVAVLVVLGLATLIALLARP